MSHVSRGSHFSRPDAIVYRSEPKAPSPSELLVKFSPDCAWTDCKHPRFYDMPVCQGHAIIVYDRVNAAHKGTRDTPELGESFPIPPRLDRTPYVYYLRIDPTTVKIGYTKNLHDRITGLRYTMDDVMALEVGDRSVEFQRHKQFAEERDGRRENFELSERLQAHIDALAPKRSKLMADAVRKRSRSKYRYKLKT